MYARSPHKELKIIRGFETRLDGPGPTNDNLRIALGKIYRWERETPHCFGSFVPHLLDSGVESWKPFKFCEVESGQWYALRSCL